MDPGRSDERDDRIDGRNNGHSDGRTHDDGRDGELRTRRRYLAGLAAAGTVAIAGCGGDGGGGGGDSDDGGSTAGRTETDGSETSSGDDGSGTSSGDDGSETSSGDDGSDDVNVDAPEGCPQPPYEYERQSIPAGSGSEEPSVTVEVPAGADEVQAGLTSLIVYFQRGDIGITPNYRPGSSVEDIYRSGTDFEEVTSEYDLPSSARATRRRRNATQNQVRVYFPIADGAVLLTVTVTNPEECEEAINVVRDEMIESLQAV